MDTVPLVSVPPLVAALALASLGTVSLLSSRLVAAWRIFAIFCFLLCGAATSAFWAVLSGPGPHAVRFARLIPSFTFLSFFFAIVYVGVMTNLDYRGRYLGQPVHFDMRAWPWKIQFGSRIIGARTYLVAVAVFLGGMIALFNFTDLLIKHVQPTRFGARVDYGWLIYFALFFYISGCTKILFFLYEALKSTQSEAFRSFLRINLIAFGAVYAPILLVAFILPHFGHTLQFLTFDAMTLAVGLFYVGIVRYQVQQVDELNRTLEQRVSLRTRELRSAQVRLEEAERLASLGQLAAGVAHEINTPLGAVQSMQDSLLRATQLLKTRLEKDGGLSKELIKPFSVIERAHSVMSDGTDRVSDAVNRLKSFALLDSAEKQTVDIRRGLSEAIDFIEDQLPEGVVVERSLEELPKLSCFPARLNQVWLNLLLNARDAMKNRTGSISVHTEHDGHQIRVVVEDQGEGISEDALPHVFNPGYTTRGVGVGIGLGLSICYQVIQDHGGEIGVVSKVGHGTRFTVELPTRAISDQTQSSNLLET